MRHLLITILIILNLYVHSRSQERKIIHVIVLDESTLKPIQGADIQLVNNGQRIYKTDSTGRAALELSGDRLFVSSNGYNSRYYTLDSAVSQPVTILLHPLIEILEQTVVSAGRYEQPLKKTSASIETLKPVLLENRNSLTIKDGLIQIPGVTITDNQVNIRNGSGWSYGAGSRVMVLVDDMPMLSGDAATPLWTFINTDAVRRVEVIKGASSVLYGSSALTGVINVQTEKPGIKPRTYANGFYGRYVKPEKESWIWNDAPLRIFGFGATHLRRVGKFGVTVNVNGQMDDGYRMGDEDNRIRFGTHISRAFFDDRLVTGVRVNLMEGRSSSFLLWQNYDSAYTALNQQVTTTVAGRQAFDYYAKYFGRDGLNILFQTRQLLIDNEVDNGNVNNDQSNSSTTGYYEMRISKQWTKAEVHGGYLWQQTTSQAPLFEGEHTTRNYAPYLQLVFHPVSSMTFELGGRYETYKLDDKTARKPVFRSGLNYQLGKYSFFRASLGQGFRFPTIAESFIRTTVGLISIYPNPDLRPETGWNAEFGFKQGFRINNLKLIADLSVFQMEYQDMMEFIFTQWSTDARQENGFGYGFKSVNVGRTRINGADLSVLFEQQLKNKNRLEGLLGYTYTLPVFVDPGRTFTQNAFGKALTFDNTSSNPENQILKYRYRHVAKLNIRGYSGPFDAGIYFRYNSYMENIDAAFVEFPINAIVRGIAEAREADKGGNIFVDLQFGVTVKDKIRFGVMATNIFRNYQMSRPADVTGPGSVIFMARGKF